MKNEKNVKWWGAAGDGMTDDSSVISAVDSNASLTGHSLRFPPGPYYFNSSQSLSADLIFDGGVILLPNTGVTITISGRISYKDGVIFDDSLGGSFSLSQDPVQDLRRSMFNDLNAALTAIGSNDYRLILDESDTGVSGSVGANVTLQYYPGVTTQIPNSSTLTINGSIEAGSYQIFDISLGGAVAFGGNVGKVDVKWFGATGDGTTDDSSAIDAADAAAATAGCALYFPRGTYRFSSSQTLTADIVMDKDAVIEVDNTYTVTINGTITAGPWVIFDTSAGGTVTLGDVSHERYDEWFDDDTPWSSKRIGSHGEAYEVRTVKTELTALSGATATWSSAIPAGSEVLGVSARVTTLITGATTFDIGDGTDVDRWGAAITLTAGTTVDLSDMTDFTRHVYASATNIVLTANGSDFTAGAVRLVLHYRQLTAPTS